MKKALFIFCLIACALPQIGAAGSSSPYLKHRIPRGNHRWETFRMALKMMEERNVKTIVETGTARNGDENFEGDGGSSILYSLWAKDHGAEFYSVDIDTASLIRAKRAVGSAFGVQHKKLPSYLHFVCSDSIDFLQQFQKPIDFLYLDSYDYDLQNPGPSQEHHLREIQAAYHALTPQTIILIDDCGLPGGGKGKLVIDFLLDRGWQIAKEGYQVLLVYPGSQL